MYYLKYLSLILLLFLSLGMVSAENPTEAINGGENGDVLTLNDSIVIDDSNFNSYFDDDGYIISDDIKENSTIYFGNISNRNVIIDMPLNLAALNSTSQVINSNFKITDDGSGTTIKNMVFKNTLGKDYTVPICIYESSNNVITNNVILVDFDENSFQNVVGLYLCGESLNNEISFNRIAITSTNSYSKHYAYGIELTNMLFGSYDFSRYSPSFNRIVGNLIEISSDYYSGGIYSSNALNTLIDANEFYLNSPNLVYGIIGEYFDTTGQETSAYNITISNNKINANSSMIYLVELFRTHDIIIRSNELTGVGDAVYGIAGYSTYNNIIYDNDILVNGSDVDLVGENFDAIASGHNAIYYMKGSFNITITDNRILSYYDLGNDYSIKFDSSCSNMTVIYNNMSSNNNSIVGDDSVIGDAYIFNNLPYSDKEVNIVNYTIVDIYVDGSNVKGNGSIDNPFTGINEALLYLKNLIISSDDNYKGIIHISNGTYAGLGRNIGLSINGMNVELIGESYNTTFIKGGSSTSFFDISKDSNVAIKNITFIDGILRKNDLGLIINKGQLSLEDCIFLNSRVVASSAIVYNYGVLKLSHNIMQLTSPNGHVIYNKGLIDNLILNYLGDSILEEERTIVVDSPNVELFAYLHDDMGNPVTGGSIKFSIQGREFTGNFDVNKGMASFDAIISLNGDFRVSGRYSGSLTNTFINIGYIKSSVILDNMIFYVSNDGDDINGNGSLENPFKTVEHTLSFADVIVDHFTIKLLEGSYNLSLDGYEIPYGITISGVKDKTYIKSDCYINMNSNVELNNLIFEKTMINNSLTTLTVKDCYFTKAPISAIYSRNADLTVMNCTFVDNGVADYHKTKSGGVVVPESMEEFNCGGAIHNIGGKLTIISSNFTDNKAVFGGAIYNNQSDLYISSSTFSSNLAHVGVYEVLTRSFGGAIYQFLGRNVVISDCVFYDNYANGFGGAFYSSGLQPCANDYEDYYPSWDWPYSSLGYSFQEIYFINCIFNRNVAPYGGGGTYIMDNLFTQYIGCVFLDNVVYTYDPATTEGNYIGSLKTSADLMFSEQMNLGGAMHDKNLLIVDSTFKSNSFDSGGALILPSTSHKEYIIDSYRMPRFENYGDGGQEIYVADSSLLTGDDALYLGIAGWESHYDGPSISKFIPEYYENIKPYLPSYDNGGDNGGNGNNEGNGNGDDEGSGSGDGSSTTGGNGDSGNGNGNSDASSGNSGLNGNGYLSLNDIYNIIGRSTGFVTLNGEYISISDFLNRLNQQLENINNYDDIISNDSGVVPANDTNDENDENIDDGDDFSSIADFLNELINQANNIVDNSTNVVNNNEVILVNGTDDEFNENSEGNVDNGGEVVPVGESLDPLTGLDDSSNPILESSESSMDSSSSNSESNEGENSIGASNSFSNPPADSNKAYEVSKDDVSKDVEVEDNSFIISLFIILLVVLLLIAGFVRNKSDE